MWGFGQDSPKPSASQRFLGPETRQLTPKSLKSLLPVFHFCICVSFPLPLEKPFRRTGKKRKRKRKRSEAPREIGSDGAGPAVSPALPTCARGEVPTRLVQARLTLPRNYPAFAATSSFYRFGCAERRGYYRSKPVLFASFPAPFPGLCFCSSVTQQKARGAAPRPLNGRRPAAPGRTAGDGWKPAGGAASTATARVCTPCARPGLAG